MRPLVTLTAVLLLALLWGCDTCYPTEEQQLKLIFLRTADPTDTVRSFISSARAYDTIHVRYDRVYAPGRGSVPYEGGHYRIPIDLNADSELYVLERTGGNDTLSFAYERRITFQSDRCGYTVKLDYGRKLPATTFSAIDVRFAYNQGILFASLNRIYEVAVLVD